MSAAEKAFRSLTDGARRALRFGYAMARRLVRAQMRRLCLLVGSLLHLRRLDGAAVSAVLGSRAPMVLLGICGRADFILERP